LESLVRAEPVGELQLKGFLKPVPVFEIVGLKRAAA
jgi:class 3 adenylate cyclase